MKLKSYPIGTLAYYDTVFAGLIKCKVLHVDSFGQVKAIITTKRNKYYTFGDVISAKDWWLPPRDCVRLTKHGAKIIHNYKYEISSL